MSASQRFYQSLSSLVIYKSSTSLSIQNRRCSGSLKKVLNISQAFIASPIDGGAGGIGSSSSSVSVGSLSVEFRAQTKSSIMSLSHVSAHLTHFF
jgi:hypothetical protein